MNAVDQVLKLAFQSLDLSLQPNYALDDVSHMILVVLILDLLYTKTRKKKNPFINYFQIIFRFRPTNKFGETRHTYCELGLKFVNWLNVLRFVAELVAIVVVKLFPICMMNRLMNPHSNQCQKYRIHRFVLPCLIVILCMQPLDAIEFQINNDIVKSIGYEKLGEKKWNWKRTVLLAASVDLTGTSASSETVRRMHDDSVALSNKCVLPVNQSIFFSIVRIKVKFK